MDSSGSRLLVERFDSYMIGQKIAHGPGKSNFLSTRKSLPFEWQRIHRIHFYANKFETSKSENFFMCPQWTLMVTVVSGESRLCILEVAFSIVYFVPTFSFDSYERNTTFRVHFGESIPESSSDPALNGRPTEP